MPGGHKGNDQRTNRRILFPSIKLLFYKVSEVSKPLKCLR